MKHFGFVCAVTAVLLLGPGSLCAQEQEHTIKNQRSGFYIGLGFGPGTLSLEGEDGTDRGISNMLRIGGAVSQNVLIGVNINGWFNESVGLVFGTVTGAVHYYPSATAGFFLTGGAGVGVEYNGEGSGLGLGVLLGLGYDLRVGKNVSFTPFVNGFASSIEDSYERNGSISYRVAQIGVGLTMH